MLIRKVLFKVENFNYLWNTVDRNAYSWRYSRHFITRSYIRGFFRDGSKSIGYLYSTPRAAVQLARQTPQTCSK